MKSQRSWATLLAVALAALVLVPTTFAIGEQGTTLYATLAPNRFPAGSGASAQARLRFIDQNTISFDVTITGTPSRAWAARIYSRGSCNFVRNWVANRDDETDAVGYLQVMSNTGEKQELLTPRDVTRIRVALARGQRLIFMVAGTHPTTGESYRTCVPFTSTPPVTTGTASTSATVPTTSGTSTGTTTGASVTTGTATTSATTSFPTSVPTGTSTLTTNTQSTATTTTSSTFSSASLCFTYTDTGGFATMTTFTTATFTGTLATTTSTLTGTATTTTTSFFVTSTCFPANI